MTTPPIDTHGEMKAAQLLLTRTRTAFKKSGLPAEWRGWVLDSLIAGETELAKQAKPETK